MRALAIRAPGSAPELMDLPKPAPGPGEVLLHLGAASVNPYDWKLADHAGADGGAGPFPFILGVDGAGVVEGLGPGATKFKVGDGLFGQLAQPSKGSGTYAEFIAVPETQPMAPIPRGIYTGQAAAIPTAGMTALAALDAMGMRKGQTILIRGAKGGIGSFATQLASNLGILVVAASRGDHGTFLRKLGAYEYFDHGRIGWIRDYRSAHPMGVDGALDLVGDAHVDEPTAGLVRDGGVVASPLFSPAQPPAFERGIRALPVDLTPSHELLDRLSKEIATGRLRIPLETQVPLAQAMEALEQNRQGLTRGKTVINL